MFSIIANLKRVIYSYRSATFFSLFSFVNSGLNFILLLFIARWLTKDEYGQLNLYTMLVTLLGFCISLNSTGYIPTIYFQKEKNYIGRIINICIGVTSIVLILYLIIVGIFNDSLSDVLGIPILYLIIAGIVCFCQIFPTMLLDIWRLEESIINYGFFSCVLVFIRVAFTILVISYLNNSWIGFPIAQLIVFFGAAFIAIVILVKKQYIVKERFCDKIDLIKVLAFGVPLIPHSISSWIRQGLDRYIINLHYPLNIVGEYSLVFNISNVIHILALAFNSYFSVLIYKELSTIEDEPSKEDTIRKNLKIRTSQILLFFVCITILAIILSKLVCPYIFPQYEFDMRIIFPLCLSALAQSIYYLFVNYLFYYKKTINLMVISICVTMIHIILSSILISKSMYFAANITLLSNIGISLLVYMYANKLFPLKK